ncbi:MAG: hypothetical protein JWS08_09775 [Phormidium sp. PBR-2020]|nr:MAG: hypothetical protein JWS08_09775 [Phormidium sp. PBR-2020]
MEKVYLFAPSPSYLKKIKALIEYHSKKILHLIATVEIEHKAGGSFGISPVDEARNRSAELTAEALSVKMGIPRYIAISISGGRMSTSDWIEC